MPANLPLPPAPRLQVIPRTDLDRLHAAEQAQLTTFGWVDRSRQIAQCRSSTRCSSWPSAASTAGRHRLPQPAIPLSRGADSVMQTWIPLWLPGETAHAGAVDLLFIGLLVSSGLVLASAVPLLLRFAIHYRAGNADADRDHRIKKSWHWEVSWTAATLVAFLGLFVWGAQLYLNLQDAPKDALPVYVVAKQWMWKVQHLGGQREINELHMPLGPAVRLIMSSQDVIHSFFIPAFRIKHDVVPGTTADDLVPAAQGRRVSSVLRGILRHRSFAHDRPHRGDGAGRIRAMAGAAGRDRHARGSGRPGYSGSSAAAAVTARAPRCARRARGTLRQAGAVERRHDRDRRRALHSRRDPQAAQERSPPVTSR